MTLSATNRLKRPLKHIPRHVTPVDLSSFFFSCVFYTRNNRVRSDILAFPIFLRNARTRTRRRYHDRGPMYIYNMPAARTCIW